MGSRNAKINMVSRIKLLFIFLLIFHVLMELFGMKLYPSFLFPQFYGSDKQCFCQIKLEDIKGTEIPIEKILDTKEKKFIYTYKSLLCSNNNVDKIGNKLLLLARKHDSTIEEIVIRVKELNRDDELEKTDEYHYKNN